MIKELFDRAPRGIAVVLLVIAAGCGTKDGEETSPVKKSAKAANYSQDNKNRVQWNLDTLVAPYLDKGHRDAAWDEAATNALAKFALMRGDGARWERSDEELMRSYCREAVLKGCTDPVVLYLNIRFVLRFQDGTTDAILAEAYKKAGGMSRQYRCAPIRLFYLALRASEAINYTTDNKASSPEVHQFRHIALASLSKALDDPAIPPIEAYEACRELMAAVDRNPQQRSNFFKTLEPILMNNWPKQAFVHLLKAEFYVDEAWSARGSGYSDTVTADGWKLFGKHLDEAAAALETAWKLDPKDPKIASEMLRVELGQGKGRERMELWFERAMALDTNYYEPCKRKLFYLEPKWHGSPHDMLAFARECAASDKWGGNVPLVALDAHDSLAAYARREGNTNYWKQPFVWRDLQSAFEKFFSLNPADVDWRHNYAKYAYQCEQWDVFKKQLLLFNGTNYSYFGGRETFERMVGNAEQKTKRPPP